MMTNSENTLIVPFKLMREDGTFNVTMCLSQMSLKQLRCKMKQDIFLHHEEKEYFDTLKFDRRKASYLLGRYCAKSALSSLQQEQRMDNILIRTGVFGQPVIYSNKLSGVQVSISHSEEFGCALAFDERHPMAIDIEIISSKHEKLIKTELTEQEKILLHSKWRKKEGHEYTWIWTVKETLGKVLKTGLTSSMAIYEVSDWRHENDYVIAQYKNFSQYKVLSFLWKNAVVSMAFPYKSELSILSHCIKIKSRLFKTGEVN